MLENNEFILLRSILLERHARTCVESVYAMNRMLDESEIEDTLKHNTDVFKQLRSTMVDSELLENLIVAFFEISGYDIHHLIPNDLSLEEMIDTKRTIIDVGLKMIEISENVLLNRS